MTNVTQYDHDWVADGFIAGLPEAEYHAHKYISKSGLDRVDRSPAHYRQAPGITPSTAMLFGTAMHRALLEPERYAEYVICDANDRRQKAYKDAVKEYGVENVLLPGDAANIEAIQIAAFSRPDIRSLVHAEGWSELSAFATDPVTGVGVRCRYDRLAAAGFAVDVKKARDVFAHGFARSVAAYRYHVQAALYMDVHYWITGERLTDFWLIAIEDCAPHTAVPWRLDDMAIEAGRLAYQRNLHTYAECMSSGNWPMYKPESNLLALPSYALEGLDDDLEVF